MKSLYRDQRQQDPRAESVVLHYLHGTVCQLVDVKPARDISLEATAALIVTHDQTGDRCSFVAGLEKKEMRVPCYGALANAERGSPVCY